MNRREKLGDEWEPKWKSRMRKQDKIKLMKMQEAKPAFPPELTNKQRHEIRRKARKDAMKIIKEAIS